MPDLVALGPSTDATNKNFSLLDMDMAPEDVEILSKIKGISSMKKHEAEMPEEYSLDALSGAIVPVGAPVIDPFTGAIVPVEQGLTLTAQTGALVLAMPRPDKPTQSSTTLQGSVCTGCKHGINQGRYLSCVGHSWHPQCFKCPLCSKIITDLQIRANGAEPFHSDCYKAKFHPMCSVCSDYVVEKTPGVVEVRTQKFWGDRFCPAHETDATPSCSSCHRFQQKHGVPFSHRVDGRQHCSDCTSSAVICTEEVKSLVAEVAEFVLSLGVPLPPLPALPPAIAVDATTLRAALQAEGLAVNNLNSFTNKGISLRLPLTTHAVFRSSSSEIEKREINLEKTSDVVGILILYGLPRVEAGALLARELMHTYMVLSGDFPSLPVEVEEGLCQFVSYQWILSQSSKYDGSAGADTPSFQQKLLQYCQVQIADSDNCSAASGFRLVQGAVGLHGFAIVLDHVKRTGYFPIG
eukprot:TRINITY_DN3432_c0_g1_i3.p1 TRINITY_DN3432_c0_g1~~TRINITY_DN3432_c0_g1_i3.p1  ORF type:complete len:523 (+),score=130.49 TRINITY_DN3432_c0_g1_i3:177-1571(+)